MRRAATREAPGEAATVYEGARLIVGNGEVIENASFVVVRGKFSAVGAAVDAPAGAERVSLAGMTVIPALVDAHTHLGTTREELLEDRKRHAYFGVGAALSLGMDDTEAPLDIRGEVIPGAARYRSAGRGNTSPEPGRS